MLNAKYSNLYTRRSIGLIDDSKPADMSWLATLDIQTELSMASAVGYFKIMVDIFLGGDPSPEKMLPLLLSDFQYDESRSVVFGHARNKLFREISCKTTLNRDHFEQVNFYGDDLLFPALDIKKMLSDYTFVKRDETLVEFVNMEKRITFIDFFVSNIHSDSFKGFSFKLASGSKVND